MAAQQDLDSVHQQPGWQPCAHCLSPGWSLVFRNAWSQVRAQDHVISSGLEALVPALGAVGLASPGGTGRQGVRVASYNPQGFCKFWGSGLCPTSLTSAATQFMSQSHQKCQLLMYLTLLSVDGGANLYWEHLFCPHLTTRRGGACPVNAILHIAA